MHFSNVHIIQKKVAHNYINKNSYVLHKFNYIYSLQNAEILNTILT